MGENAKKRKGFKKRSKDQLEGIRILMKREKGGRQEKAQWKHARVLNQGAYEHSRVELMRCQC